MKKLVVLACSSIILTSAILFSINVYSTKVNRKVDINKNSSVNISEINYIPNHLDKLETNDSSSSNINSKPNNTETEIKTNTEVDSETKVEITTNTETDIETETDSEYNFEDDIEIIYNSDIEYYDGINTDEEINRNDDTEENIEEDIEDSIQIINSGGYDHYDNWIWVGDSRTVGMSNNIGLYYLAKSGEGLDWFSSVSNELYDLKGYNIIINFGINDWWNVLNYANFYNNMPEEVFKYNKVFFVSVNPVDESYGYVGFNSTVQWFNENLRNNIRNDIIYIDTYSYLIDNGFSTIDGIHYDYNTDVNIYNYVVNTIIGT